MWVLLALVTIPTWGWVYWDFGDGNYMYIARRVREGLILYKDILAPQPPLHTAGGMMAESIGAAIFGSELIGVRAYCLLTRMVGSLYVMLLAWRFFDCGFRAVAAAAIYLTLPIGFWWSMGYQSENLENVFLVAALFHLISWSPKQVALAGFFSALACHCNMTGMPYLLANALFLGFRRWRLLPWYLGCAFVVYTVIAIGVNIWTEGFFVTNVLLNQVGTFPRTDILASMGDGTNNFWRYAWGKISSQTMEVLALEAGFIIAAAVGAVYTVVHARNAKGDEQERLDTWHRAEFMAWQLIAGLLSICFTAKGGTVNYIFVLGEPQVAVFAATALVLFLRKTLPGKLEWKQLSLFNTEAFLRILFPFIAIAVVYIPSIKNIRLTLEQRQVELPESRVLVLREFINTYADPGDTILAPPFYAFLTETNVAGEIAENYIWNIKYMNETFDAQMYGKPTGEAVEKMNEVAELLNQGEVKVVLLDTEQTGTVPAIRKALQENYQLAEDDLVATRNTTLQLWVPKGVRLRHDPLW